ncbi:hypothetical protein O9H85_37155 [Paenibacillus filicis]|uniref:Uncharacterized protein n=1 Tax=Paenibacillus gyeongsangnamensis TaxID=3388067 RepID=A0ABT4QLR7_9BACL|nr:hypothetical protein [Paenibacillus filicis]MCZ8517816.1 hypothetical protein [Paenibacillus filicis]
MAFILALAAFSFVAWTYAAVIRLREGNSRYNKYALGSGVLVYVISNFIQESLHFDWKIYFSLFFSVYSFVAIPFHLWLIISWNKEKKNPSENT